MIQKKLAHIAFFAALGVANSASANDWTIVPRVWVFFDGVVRPQGSDTDIPTGLAPPEHATTTESEPFNVVMYGGSITRATEDGNTTVTLTGMYGKGSEPSRQIQYTFISDTHELVVGDANWPKDFDRTDIELTVQRQLTSTAGLIFGARYERFDAQGKTTLIFIDGHPSHSLDQTEVSDGSLTYDAYSFRGGLAAQTPSMFLSSKLYANLQLFVGYREQRQDHVNVQLHDRNTQTVEDCSGCEVHFHRQTYYFGPDISAGLNIPVSEAVSFDLRYRALIYYDFESDRPGVSPDSPRVTHGLNAGLMVRF